MVLKKYLFPIITIVVLAVLYFVNQEIGRRALTITTSSILQMASIIPPVFILLGLLDVWVPKEVMIKLMGNESGVRGVLLAFTLGSAAAGPLYGAFPIAALLMRKGAKFSNVLIFIGAWSTTKIPMFLFELTNLGAKFAVTRLIVDVIGIVIIAQIISKSLTKKHIDEIYKKSETL